MTHRARLLYATSRLIRSAKIPGRWLLSEIATKAFAHNEGRLAGQIGPYEVSFDLSDLLQRQMFFGLWDELPETQLVRNVLESGSVFFDLGANVGYYSLLASSLVGSEGSVHAFEPIPANVDALRQTVESNRINNIVINDCAVGDHSGQLRLYVPSDAGNSGWASIVSTPRKDTTIVVRMLSVDDYVREHDISKVSVVKLDIEGAEGMAIAGMVDLLSGADAPHLIFEVNPFLLDRQSVDSRSLTVPLAELGFSLYSFEARALRLLDASQLIQQHSNLLASKGPVPRMNGRARTSAWA